MKSFYKFSLGNFNCIALEDNQKEIDIRDELGQVEEAVLLQSMQENGFEGFKVTVGFNCLLVQNGTQNILIDAGKGTDKLVDNLAAAGLTPEEIDVIIVTHSDFDHIGGLRNFPKAQLIFPKYAYDLWTNPTIRQEMIENFKSVFFKFLPADFVAKGAAYRERYGAEILPSIKARIQFVEAEEEFIAGFKMVFAPGHRPDHYAVEISSDGNTLLHIADGFRHAVQVDHPDWYSIYDSYPEQMAESLKMLIQRAVDKNAILFGSHFKFPGLAKIEALSMSCEV